MKYELTTLKGLKRKVDIQLDPTEVQRPFLQTTKKPEKSQYPWIPKKAKLLCLRFANFMQIK